MDRQKEIEEKVRQYFRKKYGVYPTDLQLKNSIDSLRLLGRSFFTSFHPLKGK